MTRIRSASVLALAGLLVACQGGSGGTSSTSPIGTASSAAPSGTTSGATTGTVQSRKITWLLSRPTDGPIIQVVNDIAAEYAKTHPGFSLDLQTTPDRPSYLQKLETLAAGKKLPDMFDTDATPFAQKLRDQGLMVDVGEYLKTSGKYDAFRPAALDYQRFDDGGLFMLPWEFHMEWFWYNKALFQQAGVQVPTKIEDLVTICKPLRDKGFIPMAIDGQDQWPLLREMAFIPFRLTGNDYVKQLKQAKASLADEPGRRAAQFVSDLGKNQCFQTGFSSAGYTDARDLFTSGKAAIYYMGTWELGTMTADTLPAAVKDNIDWFTLPMTDGATTTANEFLVVSGIGMALNKSTFDPAVQDFLAFMLEQYGPRYALKGQFPPQQGAIDTSKLPALYGRAAAEIDKLGTRFGVPWDTQLDPTSNTRLQQELTLLAQNQITPDEFISTVDAVIKENAPKFFGK